MTDYSEVMDFSVDVPKTCQNFEPYLGRTSPGSSARLHRLCRIPQDGRVYTLGINREHLLVQL